MEDYVQHRLRRCLGLNLDEETGGETDDPIHNDNKGLTRRERNTLAGFAALPNEIEGFNLCELITIEGFNPQTASPLFNGRIPPEIRILIFQYALTETPTEEAPILPKSANVRYDHELVPSPDTRIRRSDNKTEGFDYLRPDNTEPTYIPFALLQTCRRVYLEAHPFPFLNKEYRYYQHDGPPGTSGSFLPGRSFKDARWSSSVPGANRGELARSIRLFIEESCIAESLYNKKIRGTRLLDHVKIVRITMRCSELMRLNVGDRLHFNPYDTISTFETMERDMRATDEGQTPRYASKDAWDGFPATAKLEDFGHRF